MKILTLIVVVIAILAIVTALRPKKTRSSGAARSSPRISASGSAPAASAHPYSATAITFDDSACDAVRAIGDKVFLDSERKVPVLPLPDCDAERCNCRYLHREDRREATEDRRHPSGLQAELYDAGEKQNRREKRGGRRHTDLS